MSNSSQSGSSEFDLDLDVHFLPAWAQRSSTENKYAKYEGGGEPREHERRGDHPVRRGPRDRRREGPPSERPVWMRSRPGREGSRPFQKSWRHEGPREERPDAPPPVQLNVNLLPEEKGVEALARQIRLTGRAYPLFDIGQLILKKPDRYDVEFSVIKGADGKPAQPLFLCDLDETLWLSEQEAVDHVLTKHFSTFYQTEKIPTDPPKGVYTFVSQCGMSGTILGPPNYHDYQNKLRKLHQDRFARMPFEVFKSRVKIVKDEAVVKKWIEEQSFRLEYTCLNVPETIKLKTREEVEKHFRETHLANVVKSVERHVLSGPAAQNQPHRALRSTVRHAWEDQSRFPLKLVHTLSHQFSKHGLQFFKFNKNVTFVAVARPHYLDVEATPVSENVLRIVQFIRSTPRCTRRRLIETLAPTPVASALAAPSQSGAASATGTEGQAIASAESPVAPASAAPTVPHQADAISSDVHWLVHEGHVIEFANGILELARKPVSKPPPKPPKRPPVTATEPAIQPSQPEPVVSETLAEGAEAKTSEEPDSSAAPDGAAVSSMEPEFASVAPSQSEQVNILVNSDSEEEAGAMSVTESPVAEPDDSARSKLAESEQTPTPAS